MTIYDSICTFGGVSFRLSDVTASESVSTLKSQIGMSLIEKSIPLRNTKDTVLNIKGVITGITTDIETDRAALIALDDGNYHAYDDGRHTGLNMVIMPGSLVWDDPADNVPDSVKLFSATFKEWQ